MLNIGDRIWLSGGYDMNPKWLQGGDGYSAQVISFDVSKKCVIAKLDHKIKFEDIENDWVVLFFTFKGATWDKKGIVSVFLCKIIPNENDISYERLIKNTVLMENYVTYSKI